jgi:hypothetical protein
MVINIYLKLKWCCAKGGDEPTEPVTLEWLKEIAFGWLGLMPEVFYDMELEDFFLMQKGFFNRRKNDDMSFAKVAFYIAAIHQNIAGKPLFGKRFIAEWFGEKEKQMTQEQLNERSKQIMERLEMMQKIDDEKQKKNKQIKNDKWQKN